MARKLFFVLASAALLSACANATRDYQGYVADEIAPADITPGTDNRSTVLGSLGSPSTTSLFDDNTWIYLSATRERFAFYHPRVVERTIVAIRFGEDDVVEEVLQYDQEDGRVINYASRETPTRGRELGLLEQIFGNVGRVALPQQQRDPGQIGQ
ncbi:MULTISPECIES: outer membrane protein assembly factor BamE [Ponticaulis]|jgi:outer membrane protein assembly factor BamE (lipoprotein component of BamABCDE complex)|uniref:outer membrane protein assembly factor BamE n=1 Tax=Ponticaulis TaxID=1123044 RepID=UPI0003B6AED7|nr:MULTISPECIES: outer membrane protein assembly factor BamE [Ponticaulis]MAJ08137.1 outer membrane protein assembly factor BamE [Ponticaulis sp.]MBN04844.1 outer membrane protein assembly factor BamE [Ponticaulis sp.]MDF1681377.1 outer membrane protein assembly factor BamE [Ponticaulis sp.]HBJ91501.1 outer membrane protein assembly factor BamE [Hyphomonadaceae bacterium]|tara:strand:- start:77571 stop:78035 length:465 start_codon:yes stop_codon:yes gene_type:complete